jgi:hypothetical protein
MSTVKLVVLIVVGGSVSLAAQEPRWTVDVTPASYVEAWELNDSRETLTGMQARVDRAVWRGVAFRAEWVVLHVAQSLANT